MSAITNGFLLINTIRYLTPCQLFNQVLVRIKPKERFSKYAKEAVGFSEYELWIEGLDDDPEFMKRFGPEKLLDNKLTLLNET